jgi:hypothetical protein
MAVGWPRRRLRPPGSRPAGPLTPCGNGRLCNMACRARDESYVQIPVQRVQSLLRRRFRRIFEFRLLADST